MKVPSNTHISVIIPAYNEEKSLGLVLTDLPREFLNEIIVVNNGSTDGTKEVALSYGCRVVDEPQKGYGKACLSGIAALNSETEIVVFLDGDHSDHAEQLVDLVQPILEGNYDFVLGSRLLGQREPGAMMPQAYFGNQLACFLMKMFWKKQFSDLGPFRAIRYSALKQLHMVDEDFGWTIEMQIKAVENRLRIREIPVNYRKRLGKSKISGTFCGTFLAGSKILRTIFKYRFQS